MSAILAKAINSTVGTNEFSSFDEILKGVLETENAKLVEQMAKMEETMRQTQKKVGFVPDQTSIYHYIGVLNSSKNTSGVMRFNGNGAIVIKASGEGDGAVVYKNGSSAGRVDPSFTSVLQVDIKNGDEIEVKYSTVGTNKKTGELVICAEQIDQTGMYILEG